MRYFGPVLDALRDLGGSGRPAEVQEWIAKSLNLSDAELSRVNKNGGSQFANQVAWARFYLVKAGLIDSSARGVWTLTERGKVSRLDHAQALELFREIHRRFMGASARPASSSPPVDEEVGEAPDDHTASPGDYRTRLLELLKALPPAGFERICQRLLRESGFQQVTITGRTGDGGIDGDGVVQVNAFVSFRVLFQCKRYGVTAVSAGQVRDFRGAMAGRADKGIILTTGSFSADAKREAIRDGVPPIELVDGEKLVQLFESLELGLKPMKTYAVDEAFFHEFAQL